MPLFFCRAQMGIAAVCVAALSAPSLAQEPASRRLWDGFYAGALIGGSWQQQNTSYADIQTIAPIFTTAMNLGTLSPTMKAGTPGFSGGAFLGYNMQSGPLVFGVEMDVSRPGRGPDGTEIRGPVTTPSAPGLVTQTRNEIDWLATLRARAGYLVSPRTLVYVTGGLAGGRIHGETTVTPFGPTATCDNNFFCSLGAGSATKWGWTVGAGVDYAFGSAWTVKLDYLYFDLGKISYTANEASAAFPQYAGSPNLNVTTDVTGHLLRAGIAYRF